MVTLALLFRALNDATALLLRRTTLALALMAISHRLFDFLLIWELRVDYEEWVFSSLKNLLIESVGRRSHGCGGSRQSRSPLPLLHVVDIQNDVRRHLV